ncbi:MULTISPECIES: DUF3995 domain-containing protein [Sphingobacterium]|uniref:DUF3995 domain-containing protein n=1 Tax=Sphingobacterium TaxID=28453 RepID=UPI000C0C0D10|nr:MULTISPECIES: DUF3995 domain-containing protein [Sphingobacterium]VTP99572.1 Uncharacterised protein [Sphingobacterium daejeonense]
MYFLFIFSSILLILIFLFLTAIHVYWGFGGRWGSSAVFPTKDDSIKPVMPGPIPTFTVALGLFVFGLIVFLNLIDLDLPPWLDILRKYGIWAIIVIFLVRAIGDFRYVGFFKKYRNTKFGKNDTKYYSPLCMLIGILGIIIIVI